MVPRIGIVALVSSVYLRYKCVAAVVNESGARYLFNIIYFLNIS